MIVVQKCVSITDRGYQSSHKLIDRVSAARDRNILLINSPDSNPEGVDLPIDYSEWPLSQKLLSLHGDRVNELNKMRDYGILKYHSGHSACVVTVYTEKLVFGFMALPISQ